MKFVGVISKVPAGSDTEVGQTVAVNPSAPAISADVPFRPSKSVRLHALYGQRAVQSACEWRFLNAVVKPGNAFPYDRRVPANVMAFSEPLAVAIHAVKAGPVDKRVLVIGAGPVVV